MIPITRWLLVPALLIGWLGLSAGAFTAVAPVIKDDGKFFSAEAVEKANSLIGKAQEAIQLEKNKIMAEARTEIARLVVATTQRVLAKDLTDAERSRFNESAARELSQV